jgi:hypothetical protein
MVVKGRVWIEGGGCQTGEKRWLVAGGWRLVVGPEKCWRTSADEKSPQHYHCDRHQPAYVAPGSTLLEFLVIDHFEHLMQSDAAEPGIEYTSDGRRPRTNFSFALRAGMTRLFIAELH